MGRVGQVAWNKGLTKETDPRVVGQTGFKGHHHTAESKTKIGLASMGNTHCKGKHPTIKTRAKLSLASIGNTHNKGRHPSDETRAKMSVAHRNISDETRTKISLAGKGRVSSNKGKHLSTETKTKISLAGKGRITSDETKVRMSLAQKGHFVSAETRANISLSNKGRPTWNVGLTSKTDGRVAKHAVKLRQIMRQRWESGKINKEMYNTPEHREILSRNSKQQWEDGVHDNQFTPEYKEKLRIVMNTSGVREKCSRSAKLRRTHSPGSESFSHKETKERIGRQLQALGWVVVFERFLTSNHKRYAIDVYAWKGSDVVIIEVGGCGVEKMMDLQYQYPVVLQVPKCTN